MAERPQFDGFPTGQGNVIGNPIVPVIKISANPKTLRTMPEQIDVSPSARRRARLSRNGDRDLDHDFFCAPLQDSCCRTERTHELQATNARAR